MEEKQAPPPDLKFERDENFESLYANNVQFESSVWDLQLVFGQLDQSIPKAAVVAQHTAITLPWPQATIAAYYLLINVIVQQSQNGPIQLPERVIPSRPDPSDPALDSVGKKLIEYLAWVHDQFFGPNPFAPPSPSPADQG